MAAPQIITNPENLQEQIKQLRDLMIEYHFAEEPWLKTWGPLLGTAIVVAAGILGQWLIFRLNKRKEISIKVAELYGKFKAKSLAYPLTLSQMHKADIIDSRNFFLLNRYISLNTNSDTTEVNYSYTKKIDYYRDRRKDSSKKLDACIIKTNEEKLELTEIFNQIHFYFNDGILNEYIEKFISMRGNNNKIKEYNEQLELNDFYDLLYRKEVIEYQQTCRNLFDKISKRILKIA